LLPSWIGEVDAERQHDEPIAGTREEFVNVSVQVGKTKDRAS